MKLRKKNKAIPKSFFIAVIVAMFFWLLTKLSKEYQTIIKLPVEYINIPQDKLIQSSPLKQIDLQVSATGFKLLSISIFKKKLKLDTEKLHKKINSEFYLLMANHRLSIQEQISNNYRINDIVQDTIFLDIGQLTTKKVPLKGNFNFDFKLGYHLTKPVVINPDSLLVSGPKSKIEKLQFLELKELKLEGVSKSINRKVKIKEMPQEIKFNTSEVEIIGEVDKFTEGSIELPFEIVNLADSIKVNTFPKNVTVFYQVGLTNFNKVDISSFKVECDFQNASKNNLNYFIPKIAVKPDYVTNVKIVPNKIEFLIQK